MSETFKETPLIAEHKRLNAKLAPFGGWLMPIQYEGILSEHHWTRASASLFDICHMGEFFIHGDPKKTNLETIITRNLSTMKCGQCSYASMLNEKGGIIDDLVVYRLQPEQWMIVVNAATTEKDVAHIKKHLARDAKFENISAKTAKLDLQGPLSRQVLIDFLENRSIADLKYYSFMPLEILGKKAILSRTGYTGELGFEIYIDADKVVELWDILLKDKRVKPAGLGARDTLRLEMGYSLYGQDVDESITPLESGLEKYVDFTKDFIGKKALIEQRHKGIGKELIYFMTESRRAPRHNYKIFDGEQEIGVVTSGSFSPSLGCGIGIGHIHKADRITGTEITVKDTGVELKSYLTEKPFYKNGTACSKH